MNLSRVSAMQTESCPDEDASANAASEFVFAFPLRRLHAVSGLLGLAGSHLGLSFTDAASSMQVCSLIHTQHTL